MKKVLIIKNGPYIVSGNVPLSKEIAVVGNSDEPEEWKKVKEYPKQESYALCRCGKSNNKPFCDHTHIKVNFDGTETANEKKQIAQRFSGSELDLIDIPELCSSARFCHFAEGTWSSVENSDNPRSKKIAIQTACNCPSGRLTVCDKHTQKPIEPKFEQSISLIEDPQAGVSGPIWVKGYVNLESEKGTIYKSRNRATLCRCGKSRNKPFCDSSHIDAKFNDG